MSSVTLAPFHDVSEAVTARGLFDQWFRVGPQKDQGLWWNRGKWIVWRDLPGVWESVGTEEVIDEVYLVLEKAQKWVETPQGRFLAPYGPTVNKVNGVVRALRAMAGAAGGAGMKLPRWAGRDVAVLERNWDSESCVAFEDVVVSVKGGELATIERDHRWLSVNVVRGAHWGEGGGEQGEECPTWMRCLEQWSCGDPEWVRLLQRWVGYLMAGHRRYERWFVLMGTIRGGKSTIIRVCEWLVGGAVCGGTLTQLANPFYRTELATARLLAVGEASKQDSRTAGEISALVKSCVGRDTVSVAEMYGFKGSVRTDAAVMMASNLIPDLPDEGRGLTGKMLVLPFTASFIGKEDTRLEDKLRKELGGIAKWAVEGLRQLEASESGDRWPMPDKSKEMGNRFALLGNVLEAFLEARFERNEAGFVSGEIVRREWANYVKKNKLKGVQVADNQLMVKLEMESSWGLRRDKSWKGKERGVRGLKGLSWKKVSDDEV